MAVVLAAGWVDPAIPEGDAEFRFRAAGAAANVVNMDANLGRYSTPPSNLETSGDSPIRYDTHWIPKYPRVPSLKSTPAFQDKKDQVVEQRRVCRLFVEWSGVSKHKEV